MPLRLGLLFFGAALGSFGPGFYYHRQVPRGQVIEKKVICNFKNLLFEVPMYLTQFDVSYWRENGHFDVVIPHVFQAHNSLLETKDDHRAGNNQKTTQRNLFKRYVHLNGCLCVF